MPINKNTTKKEEKTMTYEVKAHHVRSVKNKPDNYTFTLSVNGVEINWCKYITYTDDNGDRVSFVSFPQYQGKDGKYYNHAYFKITDELFKVIEDQITEEVNKGGK